MKWNKKKLCVERIVTDLSPEQSIASWQYSWRLVITLSLENARFYFIGLGIAQQLIVGPLNSPLRSI
jgi:hypothetical protein